MAGWPKRKFLTPRGASRSPGTPGCGHVQKRLGSAFKLRADLIGAISILGDDAGEMRRALPDSHARDVRLRLAGEHADRAQAERILREVNALYTCGPAGGGGVRTALRPRLNMLSCTIPATPCRRLEIPGGNRLMTRTPYTQSTAVSPGPQPLGDKGNISNLEPDRLGPRVLRRADRTSHRARVADWFAYRHPTRVTRYLLPTLHAMNFVLEGVLDGGVNDALNLDTHGKSLSFRLLDLTVEVQRRTPPACQTSPATAPRPPDTPRPTIKNTTGDTQHAHFFQGPSGPAVAAALPLTAIAQNFPAKPITFIVPFAAGSATDQIGRAIGQGVTEQTGQAVVIENKPGASAMIGAAAGARAAPDGYTVLITTNTTHAANEHLYKTLTYQPVKDFAPISLLGKGGQIMVVNPARRPRPWANFWPRPSSRPAS